MSKKVKSVSQYKKILWPLFAGFIKNRDGWRCFTCGRYATGQGMGAGHYKPKGACGLDYYFSEINVAAQCTYCNLTLCGDQVNFRERLVKKYGEKAVLDIDMNYHKPCPDFPFEEKIEYYKKLSPQVVL